MQRASGRPRLVAFACVLALVATLPTAGRDLVRVIVQGASPEASARAVVAAGGRPTVPLPIVSGVAALVPSGSLGRLSASPGVVAVTPDERVAVQDNAVSETAVVKPVFREEVGADAMAAEGYDGTGIRVALIDTGVTEVRDLRGRLVPVPDPVRQGRVVRCVNFSGEPSCDDTYGHGTFIAGLIAGNGASSDGRYMGVAPKTDIVPVKIAGEDGSADVSKVLAAIQWVVSFRQRLNIRVLNLSLGTNSKVSYRFDPLNLAVQRAWNEGIVVVVSAGNLGPLPGTISKPGDDPLVITVGAVDDRETPALDDDRLPKFSARGPTVHGVTKPDVVAPGGRVVSLRSPGSFIERRAPAGGPKDYRRGSGTSMAAAIVSGAAALLLQARPGWDPDRVKHAFRTTAREVATRDQNQTGMGLIRVPQAMRAGPGAPQPRLLSDGRGSLDGSRGTVFVTKPCLPGELVIDPECEKLDGDRTAQGLAWDAQEYATSDWNGSSWYDSQWTRMFGTEWYGSSWYDDEWLGDDVTWNGSSWYGNDDDRSYGRRVPGSSWYGAWD